MATLHHENRKKIISIAVKLSVGITTLMLVVTAAIVIRSTDRLREISYARESDKTADDARWVSEQVYASLQSYYDKTKIVAGILYKPFPSEKDRDAALDISFFHDPDLVDVEIIAATSADKPISVKRVVNEAYLKKYELKSDFIDQIRQTRPLNLQIPFNGEATIRNSTLSTGAPMLSIGIPLVRDDADRITHIAVADVKLDRLQKIFSDSLYTTYVVDRTGQVVLHSEESIGIKGTRLTNPIVKMAMESTATNYQKVFVDPETEDRFIGAFVKMPSQSPFRLIAVSQVAEDDIMAPARIVRVESISTAGYLSSIALLGIVLFSTTLTRSLGILVDRTREIAKGNFDVKAGDIKSHDEVGLLARAFDNMVLGLKERDKVKKLFGKFHGKVAEKLISGEINLGGESREATVFFSDIRGFTSFSERVSPQEVVAMLNAYFKIMVSIINKYNGQVDKFIGDAIMAVWGAPDSQGKQQDAVNAVNACMEMREALVAFNEKRKGEGLPVIYIGIGLHTGPLIAGNVGSEDLMNYTVIGDTVNVASRIESATKAYGTDLLMSEDTCELVRDKFAIKDSGSVGVQGKSEPLRIFQVTGRVADDGTIVQVTTPYSNYEPKASEKVKTSA